MAMRRMAEGGEAKRSCPPPTEAEQAQERRAAEARGAAATRAQRSPKQPKPRRPKRKAAAEAPTKTAEGASPLPTAPTAADCPPADCPCRLPRLLTSAARQTPMHTGSPHVRPTARPPQSLRRGFAAAPLRGGRLTPHKS